MADWYAPYPSEDVADPSGATTGEQRVIRGGNWQTDAAAARCAARGSRAPSSRDSTTGFRVAGDRVPAP